MQQRRFLRSGVSRLMVLALSLAVSLIASNAVIRTAHAQPGSLSAGGPYEGRVGDPIAMEGSLAVTPGSVVQWRWTFGDGGMELGQVVSHTYSSPGTYTVELAVTLQNGEVRTASTTAQVAPGTTMPGQLTVQADGPYNGRVGVPVSFNAEVGLGGRPPGTVVEVTWSFGDGSTGSGRNTTHTYSNPGTYRVTVRATVGPDQQAFDSTTASIVGQQNIGLSAGGPYIGQVAQNITMTGSAQSPAQIAEWQWRFGDGTSASGRVVQKGYTNAGIYQVTLTAILTDGQAFVATTTATISGTQPPPPPQTEPVRLVTGCNNVALTWQVGTPLMTVVNAVAPPGVTESIFTLDAAQGRFRGYSPNAPSFANDFTMVETSLQAVYICVTASATLNRPAQ
ncbi:MAG: PKD domain-containing protein [Dehalococcoidia bacterium]